MKHQVFQDVMPYRMMNYQPLGEYCLYFQGQAVQEEQPHWKICKYYVCKDDQDYEPIEMAVLCTGQSLHQTQLSAINIYICIFQHSYSFWAAGCCTWRHSIPLKEVNTAQNPKRLSSHQHHCGKLKSCNLIKYCTYSFLV